MLNWPSQPKTFDPPLPFSQSWAYSHVLLCPAWCRKFYFPQITQWYKDYSINATRQACPLFFQFLGLNPVSLTCLEEALPTHTVGIFISISRHFHLVLQVDSELFLLPQHLDYLGLQACSMTLKSLCMFLIIHNPSFLIEKDEFSVWQFRHCICLWWAMCSISSRTKHPNATFGCMFCCSIFLQAFICSFS